jgi:hypothetical protein
VLPQRRAGKSPLFAARRAALMLTPSRLAASASGIVAGGCSWSSRAILASSWISAGTRKGGQARKVTENRYVGRGGLGNWDDLDELDEWQVFMRLVLGVRGSPAAAGRAAARRLKLDSGPPSAAGASHETADDVDPEKASDYAETYTKYAKGEIRPRTATLWGLAADLRSSGVAPWAAGPVVLYAASRLGALVSLFSFAKKLRGPKLGSRLAQLELVTHTIADPTVALLKASEAHEEVEAIAERASDDPESMVKAFFDGHKRVFESRLERHAHSLKVECDVRRNWTLSKRDEDRLGAAWARASRQWPDATDHDDDLAVAHAVAYSELQLKHRRRLVLAALLRWNDKVSRAGE